MLTAGVYRPSRRSSCEPNQAQPAAREHILSRNPAALRYPWLTRAVTSLRSQLTHLLHQRDPGLLAFLAITLGVLLLTWLVIHLRRPSPEEIERRRREKLAVSGRITDGVIVDAKNLQGEDSVSPTPEVLVYSYRLAGVTYNCAQDVSRLADQVLGFRLDQPIQIRYDPRNPGNSILVSESWSGLWQK